MIAVNPQAKAAYLQLARLYIEAGRKDLAATTYRRFLAIDPGNHFVRNQVDQLEGRLPAAKADAGPSVAVLRADRQRAERLTRWAGMGIGLVGLAVLAVVFRHTILPSAKPIARTSYPNQNPFWSPDGRRLAWFAGRGERGSLGVHDFASGSTREFELRSWGLGERPRWSRDGLELLVDGHSEGGSAGDSYWGPVVQVMSVLDGTTRELAKGSHASYTPDGRALVMLCPAVYPQTEEGRIIPEHMCRLDLLTGVTRAIYDREFSSFEVQPGGDQVVFQVDRPLDWDKLQEKVQQVAGDSGFDPIQSLENVVSGSGRVIDVQRGQEQEVQRLGQEAKKRGRQGDGSFWMPEADLWAIGMDGSGLLQLTTEGRSVLVGWTPEGQSILFLHQPEAGQKPELWMMDAKGGSRRRVLPAGAEVIDARGVATTPDGKRAIYLGLVPDVNPALLSALSNSPPFDLYEVALGGKEPRRLKNMHSFKAGFALSPDGKRIAYEYVDKKTGQPEIWVMKR